MHSLGFTFLLFSGTIAQIPFSGFDAAAVPEIAPPTAPNSPSPIEFTPDIGSSSYDFSNTNSGHLDLVASYRTVQTDQLQTERSPFTTDVLSSDLDKGAKESSNDMRTGFPFQPETLDADWQPGLDHFDRSCNSLSTTSSGKVRRGGGFA